MTVAVSTLPTGPVVMGVLNLNSAMLQSSSFIEHALAKAEQMLADGAALIDVSCEQIREQSGSLTLQEELNLVVPVIEVISKRVSIPISIDTSNAQVMSAAVHAGAKMINDVHALTKLNALSTAAQLNQHVCLMHMQNDPVNKQFNGHDKDIVSTVYQYLEQRITACKSAGIDARKLIIDPGFGFGKSLAQNLSILRALHVFKNLHCPILVDIAHKSMLGQILNVDVENRVFGSVAAEVVAVSKGADIIRSHDVRASVDAIKVYKAIST